MSGLRAPGLGPIVGATTDRSCRIWIRAEDPADKGALLDTDRRTLGVIAVVAEGGNPLPKSKIRVHYFRLHREFDRTGTFILGVETGIKAVSPSDPLSPDTTYTIRVGTLTIDDPHGNDENIPSDEIARLLPDPSVWLDALLALGEAEAGAQFRTFPKVSAENLGFVLGSCRYPGVLAKTKLADKIFGPLRREADIAREGGIGRFALMVGDQIYADKLNRMFPIGRADTYEEFQERYLTAFGSTNMRRLLRTLPTYMILDDHEIEDNWTQDRLCDSASARLFNLAISAYMSYQWSHSPRNFGRRLYYTFECAGFPFFVLDTRTQRYMDDIADSLDDNHMLGRPALHPDDEPAQIDRLLDWLRAAQDQYKNAPKFVVTSSVFVPNPMDAREGSASSIAKKEKSDSWPAFPVTRRAILSTIIDHKIQNVVFLAGDIHCSNVAQMSFSGSDVARRIRAFAVTSSAFYWPFPLADGAPSDYVHDSTAAKQEDTFVVDPTNNILMNYRAWNFTQVDNFCRIDVSRSAAGTPRMIVRMFDNEGGPISNERRDGTRYLVEATLDLEPW